MPPETRVPEAVIARLRPHARAVFWPSLALIATIGAFFYFFGSFEQLWQNLAVAAGAIAAVLFLWLLPLLSWLGRHYTITTRRIVLRKGFVTRVRQELLHSRGYDLTVRQNALQTMFRSGDIEINTGLERPIVLRDVPGADLVQSALHDLMEQSLNPVAARRQQEQSVVRELPEQQDETIRWGER
ncbi:MAG: PH domain-containing protein [Microbacteriaceae bacterium]